MNLRTAKKKYEKQRCLCQDGCNLPFIRIIDIFKLLGCRLIDQNIKGGWGVMLDDVLAGCYALLLLLAGKSLFL